MKRACVLWASSILSVAFSGPAHAAVSCGDVITGHATLTSDLDCGDTPIAITIDGGRLDMAAHTITGVGVVGVYLIGRGSRLSNGQLRNFRGGIWSAGVGQHRIANVLVTGASSPAVHLDSSHGGTKLFRVRAVDNDGFGFLGSPEVDGLLFDDCSAEKNGSGGFLVYGANVRFVDCVASKNVRRGFQVSGFNSKFTGCVANRNGLDGFLAGSSTLVDCRASGNGESGFDVGTVPDTPAKIDGCIADENAGYGYRVGYAVVRKSLAMDNGGGVELLGRSKVFDMTVSGSTDAGVVVQGGSRHVIDGNSITRSGGHGIHNRSRHAIKVLGNFVLASGDTDIQEDNSDCLTNRWHGNVFSTANQACVQ